MDFSQEKKNSRSQSPNGDETSSIPSLNDSLKDNLASLFSYMQKRLGIREIPSVTFTKSQTNADDQFGLTAYYNHTKKNIRLYITDRHNTDILRSFAHEVIHHWQNEQGTLGRQESGTEEHYAQNDPNLRKREMEAYLFGNILFRDWQDEQRYGPPKTQPTLPDTINENLIIQDPKKLQDGLRKLLQLFVKNGTITSYHRDLTSGDMNPVDFVNDFVKKLSGALSSQIQTINDRGNWENQPNMIK